MLLRRSRAALAGAALPFLLAVAIGRAEEPSADQAAAELLAGKGLRSSALPDEQWIGSYAGSTWMGSIRIAVTEKDEKTPALRRIDVERRHGDPEDPERELESWWTDEKGALVAGVRRVQEGESEPVSTFHYEFKDGAVRIREEPGEPDPVKRDLPPCFLPDELLAVLCVPSQPGKAWKFSSFGGSEWLTFTVEDRGPDKVKDRKGAEVTARRLVVKDREAEAHYWLDESRRIVAIRWPDLPNHVSIAGDKEQCSRAWTDRPEDDLDRAATKLIAGAAAPGKLVGELHYGVHDADGVLKAVTHVKLEKVEKDGKPVLRYEETIADLDSAAGTIKSEWWLALDGQPLEGRLVYTEPDKAPTETRAKRDANGLRAWASDAQDEKDEVAIANPVRFSPDSLLLLRALAKEESGSFRWDGIDLNDRSLFSIALTVRGTEKVTTRAGVVLAKHVQITQNGQIAQAWIDPATGDPLVVKWANDDVDVFAKTADEAAKAAPGCGPEKKDEK